MAALLAAAPVILVLPLTGDPEAAARLLGLLAGAGGLLLAWRLPPPSEEVQEALLAAAVM